ncbi:MAG: hypothetical protein J0L97_01845 [Alphaproteobacteria bacterium]|nr:hypothetical protein [Alphaproteobacteria bacterium]
MTALGFLLVPLCGWADGLAGTTWMLYRGADGHGTPGPKASPIFFEFQDGGTAVMRLGHPGKTQVTWEGKVTWFLDGDVVNFGYRDKKGMTSFNGKLSSGYMNGQVSVIGVNMEAADLQQTAEYWQAWQK